MQYSILPAEEAIRGVLSSVETTDRIVVCGEPEEQNLLDEQIEYNNDKTDIIIKSSGMIDVPTWFREREKQLLEDFEEDEFDINEVKGVWPGNIKGQPLLLHRDISSQELLPSVLVASLSVASSWEIPAHFKYGNWNECTEPEAHCAIWRYWYNKYGAEIVGVSHDVIEAIVQKPPQTERAAMELAWEQYLYCNDIVDQGVESVSNLGGTLINHDSWYFWWD